MMASDTLGVGRRDMYKTFRVKNFRCFKDLQINDLGRVNLIAGKNNTGKTALMEAMYLHTRRDAATELVWLHVKVRGLAEFNDNRVANWRQLFYGMDASQVIEIEMPQILNVGWPTLQIKEIANTNATGSIFASYAVYLHERLGMSQISAAKAVSELEFMLRFIRLRERSSNVLHGIPSDSSYPIGRSSVHSSDSYFVRVNDRPSSHRVADKYSKLKLSDGQEALISTLQQIEPRLTLLEVLSPEHTPMLWAEIGGATMPLRLFGEGTNRVCHILMTMKAVDLKYLFIDEIENGIHYSVQRKVWEAIGQMARELDIQVFATTHSREMIEAAYKAFEDDDLDDFRFHRLYRDTTTGNIEARTYNEYSIGAAIRRDYEVRG